MSRRWPWMIACSFALACSSPSGGDADAGPPDAARGVDGAFGVAPPEPPAPPQLAPCPAGWRLDGDVCDPWPAGGHATCAADEAHFPGEPGCARIGAACPAGDWPEGLPAGATVVYVRAGAGPGGAGTTASPYGTVGEALAAAPAGAVVAIARGTYDEVVVLGGRTLWGACVAETTLTSSAAAGSSGVVTISGPGAVVRNLRITGERPGVRAATAGAAVELRHVLVEGTVENGLRVRTATLVGENVVVRGTRVRPDGALGRGLSATEGAQVTLTRAAFEDNRDVGLMIADTATLVRLEDVAIRDTEPDASTEEYGGGIWAQTGSRLEAARLVVENNRQAGIAFVSAGTTAVLDDLVVRDTRGQASDAKLGFGIFAGTGVDLTVTGALVERNRLAGVDVYDASTVLRLTDSVVRQTAGETATGDGGVGLEVLAGARVEATRVRLEGNVMGGAGASGPGTILDLTDVTYLDNGAADGLSWGQHANDGGAVTGRRVLVERGFGFSISAADLGTSVDLVDVEVRDGACAQDELLYGAAIWVADGASFTAERARVSGLCGLAAVALGQGTTMGLIDFEVLDTHDSALSAVPGRALDVEQGAHVTVDRARFERARQVAVAAFGAGTEVRLAAVEVRQTREVECAGDTCEALGGGLAVGAYHDAWLEATGFIFADNVLCGVQMGNGGTMDLHDGTVARNPIGANIQTEGFDASRLQDGVVYVDNDRNLDAAMLPLPDAEPPLGP